MDATADITMDSKPNYLEFLRLLRRVDDKYIIRMSEKQVKKLEEEVRHKAYVVSEQPEEEASSHQKKARNKFAPVPHAKASL